MKKTEPLEIKTGRQYLTADGETAYILKDDAIGTHSIFGYVHTEREDYYKSWTKEGTYDINTASNNGSAIVAEIPEYELVPLDSPDGPKVDGLNNKKAKVPFDHYDDINLPQGPFFIREEPDGTIYAVSSVSESGVNAQSWDSLYHRDWEYSGSLWGPWLPFAKERHSV